VYEKKNNGGLASPSSLPRGTGADGRGRARLSTATATSTSRSSVRERSAPAHRTSKLYRGAGDGTFTAWQTLSTGFAPKPLRTGDLDGDGRIDFLVVDPSYYHPPGYMYGYLNTASGFVFLDGPRILVDVEDLALLDLDGDGDLDAASVFESGTVGTNLNNGAGVFGEERLYRVGGNLHRLATADLDLDGDDDLVVASDPNGVRDVRNEGNGFLVRATSTQLGPGLRAVGHRRLRRGRTARRHGV
jgi:hypothetical protein